METAYAECIKHLLMTEKSTAKYLSLPAESFFHSNTPCSQLAQFFSPNFLSKFDRTIKQNEK